MHLTNYAVNKRNDGFVANCSSGAEGGSDSGDGANCSSKWYLWQLQQHLEARGVEWAQVSRAQGRAQLGLVPASCSRLIRARGAARRRLQQCRL
jgi:hypothetical protein